MNRSEQIHRWMLKQGRAVSAAEMAASLRCTQHCCSQALQRMKRQGAVRYVPGKRWVAVPGLFNLDGRGIHPNSVAQLATRWQKPKRPMPATPPRLTWGALL